VKRAIGLLELRSISEGIRVADTMVKSASVELLQAMPVCPGKFVAVVAGDVSSVMSAVEAGRKVAQDGVIDHFVLANVHDAVFPAICGVSEVTKRETLGIIETFSVATAIVAADTVVKAAAVDLIEVRTARGMGGKSLVYLTGDVGAVAAAVDVAKKHVLEDGMLVNVEVIPSLAAELWEHIL
jgi:microcompartment protein CcmL/EutN